MSPATRFRKKPVVVEAVRLTDLDDVDAAVRWVQEAGYFASRSSLDDHVMKLATLEGDMFADVGDWIIRGVKGEFYPCKPDIFEATYEPVEEGW